MLQIKQAYGVLQYHGLFVPQHQHQFIHKEYIACVRHLCVKAIEEQILSQETELSNEYISM